MNIKPFIFIEAFSDTKKMMFYFLERICEMFHAGEYQYDNFYFYSECLCMLILEVEKVFRRDQNLTNEKKIEHLETLGYVLHLTNKVLNTTTIKQYDGINIVDRIQRFVERVKSDERFTCIKEIIESYLTDVKPNPKLQILFKSYFLYLCTLIQSDFMFFTITSNKDLYLVDMKSIMRNLDTLIFKKITDVEEEYCILRYYFANKLKLNITNNRIQNQALRLFKNNYLFEEINNEEDSDMENEGSDKEDNNLTSNRNKNKLDLIKQIHERHKEHREEEAKEKDNENLENEDDEDRISNLSEYDKRIQIECINASLMNLSINKQTSNKKQFEKKIRKKIEKLHEVANILYRVIVKFNDRIDVIMEDDQKEFSGPYQKYIFLLKYFEHVILRPTYKLINIFMINHQFILGQDCLIYHGLVLELLKLTVKLYLNIEKLTVTYAEDIDRMQKYYMQCFEKPAILSYENISLKKNLSQKDIEDIVYDIKNLFKIKYFYIPDIFQSLLKNVELILYTKPKFMETIKTKTTMINFKKQSAPIEPDHVIKMKEIIKDYKDSFEKTFDNELTLFNALE
jgi:hypothetical protein